MARAGRLPVAAWTLTNGAFAPALVLPEALRDQHIARVARWLSLARDLDVLRDHLEGSVLTRLATSWSRTLSAAGSGPGGANSGEICCGSPALASWGPGWCQGC